MKAIYLVLLFLFLNSCNSVENNTKGTSGKEDISVENKLSSSTKLFLQDLRKEMESSSKREIPQFKPSQQLVTKYNMLKKSGNYYIGATIHINDAFRKQRMKESGILVGTKTKGFLTVKIPVLKIDQIIKYKGIDYIQVDEKTNR